MYKIRISKSIFGGTTIIRTNDDGSITSFSENADNTDYQEYLRWLTEGNTPETSDNEN